MCYTDLQREAPLLISCQRRVSYKVKDDSASLACAGRPGAQRLTQETLTPPTASGLASIGLLTALFKPKSPFVLLGHLSLMLEFLYTCV